MMPIPSIQIHQQYAKLGIDADPGTLLQRQPKAQMEMRTTPTKLHIQSPPGDLQIDQSRAWDALGVGSNLRTMDRIYSESREIALQGIAKIVEKGNQMAAIHTKQNVIADSARDMFMNFPEFDFFGELSYDNVDIQYTARKPEIEVEEGKVDIQVQVHRPENIYNRGKLDLYMLAYPKVEITPPQIDLKI